MFNPFDINDDKDYLIWRDKKLENYPSDLEDIVVEINDPKKLSGAEYNAMHQICQKTNMVVFTT